MPSSDEVWQVIVKGTGVHVPSTVIEDLPGVFEAATVPLSVEYVVLELNDSAGWTRGETADYLESLGL